MGFDPGAAAQRRQAPGGFGLMSIRERLECLGGTFKTVSRPGRGTRSTLTLPRQREALARAETRPAPPGAEASQGRRSPSPSAA